MRFANKTILVLGGTAGIGEAAVRLFRAEGGTVALTGRNAETLDALRGEGFIAIRSDMGDIAGSRTAIAEAAAALGGKIDVLFVNAGVGGFSTLAEMTEEFWDQVHGVNLKGACFAIQSALPHLNDGGAIVITGSIGSMLPVPGNGVYASAKAGLRAAARVIGAELLPRRIRVNMVSPGPTDTEIFKRDASQEEIDGMRTMLSSVVPIGRMGTSEEVARAAVFLASDEASFINGVDLFVDGGCIELK